MRSLKASAARYRKKHRKEIKYKNAWANRNKSQSQKEVYKRYLSKPTTRFHRYRVSAEKRGLQFSLTYEEFMAYWKAPCCYCGQEIDTIGLDRVNNDVGYNRHNIEPCCKVCNAAKGTQTAAQYINRCIAVAKNRRTHGG